MGRRGSDLAARFNRAVSAVEEQKRRAEEERQRRLAEGREARDELLRDLTAFGNAIDQVSVQEHDGGVTLRYSERFLHFEPMGEGERIRVTFDGMGDDEHRLYREPELGHRWVWAFRRRGQDDRLPLFDNGLEELIVLGLQMPHPDQAPPASPAKTLEDAIPTAGSDDEADRKRTL